MRRTSFSLPGLDLPRNANLPIDAAQNANREIGVPVECAPAEGAPQFYAAFRAWARELRLLEENTDRLKPVLLKALQNLLVPHRL